MTYLVKMVERGYGHYGRVINDRKVYTEIEMAEEIKDKYAFYHQMKEKYPHLMIISYVKVLKELPNGWRKLEGSLTAPNGYYWASNGKSFFNEEFESVLIKE